MIHRLHEFFEADHGQLSMTRLLCFMSIFPASYVVIVDKAEGTLAWYLGAYAMAYVGGKGMELINPKGGINAKTTTETKTSVSVSGAGGDSVRGNILDREV